MKKRMLLSFLILLLTIPALFLGTLLSLPKLYGETYYAELSKMTERLDTAQGRKLILIGGSNVAFGTDTALLEELLSEKGYDYTVCSYGLYAAVGTSAMLSLSEDALREGDIVVLALEPMEESLTDYFGANAFWKCAESDPALLLRTNATQRRALLGNAISYVQEKASIARSGVLPSAEGVYSLAAFDEDCNLIYDRAGNAMALGFDASQPVDLGTVRISEGLAEQIAAYCENAAKKGATVYLSFSPVNASAVTDVSPEALTAFYELLDAALPCRIISDPGRYVLESAWFYDSNFHLNSAGAVLRTKLLAEDLLAALGCFEAVDCAVPAAPESIYGISEERSSGNEESDVSNFVLEEVAEGAGWTVTGLTEKGLGKSCLELPESHEGKPVVSFSADTFSGADLLEELRLPESIETIPDHAFSGCVSLKRLVLLHENAPCGVSEESFEGADDLRVYVPAAAYPFYRDGYGCEANPWSIWLDRVYTY